MHSNYQEIKITRNHGNSLMCFLEILRCSVTCDIFLSGKGVVNNMNNLRSVIEKHECDLIEKAKQPWCSKNRKFELKNLFYSDWEDSLLNQLKNKKSDDEIDSENESETAEIDNLGSNFTYETMSQNINYMINF